MTEVRTRDEAIAMVDHSLQVWSSAITAVLLQSNGVVHSAQLDVDFVVRKWANQVRILEDLLAIAKEEEIRRIKAELARAKEALDRARRVKVKVDEIASHVTKLGRSHTMVVTSQVANARNQLSRMNMALEEYRVSGSTIGGGGTRNTQSAKFSGNALSGIGLSKIDVNDAAWDENPILDDDPSTGKFGRQGLYRSDYRWLVQTWNDTVGPGIANGMTRDDFALRDARSNAQPLRRTADVYDVFVSSDTRIHADRRPDGSLNITNGRRRVLIARELGIEDLPGQVS